MDETTPPAGHDGPPTTPSDDHAWSDRRVMRSREHRMIAGVAGGIGEYFRVDPTLVRLGFVITAFFGGAGIVAYLLAWVIIPDSR